eukprot:349653-Chlamydomonas_euryale.AAC.2
MPQLRKAAACLARTTTDSAGRWSRPLSAPPLPTTPRQPRSTHFCDLCSPSPRALTGRDGVRPTQGAARGPWTVPGVVPGAGRLGGTGARGRPDRQQGNQIHQDGRWSKVEGGAEGGQQRHAVFE